MCRSGGCLAVVCGGAGVEVAQGVGGLLADDAVTEGAEHGGPGEAGGVGDPAVGEAHHPFGEDGAQSSQKVGWPGGGASEDGFPPSDGGFVIAPVKVGLPRP